MAERGTSLSREQASLEGRLLSRPLVPIVDGIRGLRPLGLGGDRDGYLYVPETYRESEASPLFVTLHGAGGAGRESLQRFLPLSEQFRLILLAPDSRWRTWDVLFDGFGPDVALMDQALEIVFSRYAVDPGRIAIEGFSDGASYALSLGLTNGDLFRHVIAFSPGFMSPATVQGKPTLFISHGISDQVLPIELCSRRLVPELRKRGYEAAYREFDGGHQVPLEIVTDAAIWLTDTQ